MENIKNKIKENEIVKSTKNNIYDKITSPLW
jgi:hypothetical protein